MINANILRAFIQLYERLKNKSQPSITFFQSMTASAKHVFEKSVGKYTDDDILRLYKLIDDHITHTSAENTVSAWAALAIFLGNEAGEMQKAQFSLLKRDSDFASTLHAMRSYLVNEIKQMDGFSTLVHEKKAVYEAKKTEINEMRLQGRYHAPTDTRATLVLELAYLGDADAINNGLDLKLFSHFQFYMGDGNIPTCLHPLHHERFYTNLFQCLTGVRYEAFIEHVEKNNDVTLLFPNNPPAPKSITHPAKAPIPNTETAKLPPDTQIKKQPAPSNVQDLSASLPPSPILSQKALSSSSLNVFSVKEAKLPPLPDPQPPSRVKMYHN